MRRLNQQQEMTGTLHNTSQVVDDSSQHGPPHHHHKVKHLCRGGFKLGSGMLSFVVIALVLFSIADLGANAVRIPDASLQR